MGLGQMGLGELGLGEMGQNRRWTSTKSSLLKYHQH